MQERQQVCRWLWSLAAISATFSFSALVIPSWADETKAVWGLKAGDRFVVSVLTVKQTEVTIGDQPATNSETRDRFEIEYRVTQVRNSGDAVIAAKLRKASRDVAESSAESLKASARSARALEDLRVGFEIDATGQILTITERDRDALLAAFSGLDASSSQLLRDSCPEDVIASWLNRPFWAGAADSSDTIPQEVDRKAVEKPSYTRKDAIAIGPFGVMQTILEIQPAIAGQPGESLTISGKGRFVPLVVPNRDPISAKIPLQNVVAELDDYSGKLRIPQRKQATRNSEKDIPEPSSEIPQLEPGMIPDQQGLGFTGMEINIRLHGSGTLPAKAGSPKQNVTFRQTQMQSWTLTEHSFARAEYLFDVPVPVPAPR